jgi:hypothetical protein
MLHDSRLARPLLDIDRVEPKVPVQRSQKAHPPDRHILLGVSHHTNDPARHRTFEIRASYDAARGGWVARVGEQNLNEQRGAWEPSLEDADARPVFLTAAACLGDAVATIVARVDHEANDAR